MQIVCKKKIVIFSRLRGVLINYPETFTLIFIRITFEAPLVEV